MKATTSTRSELAIPFITYSEKTGFQLNPDAEQFLREIPEQKHLGAVSIVGKSRTGKSFFVNRVLLNCRKAGFQVGPSINPCTKGLWIWKKTISSSTDENLETILIDTEGFGGMDENSNHDSRIFLFSLLLTSSFIYNSIGNIDENAINTLNLIINLAKNIESKSGRGDDVSQFPSFLWVVRDFTLKLVDTTGRELTSKQYLENALEEQKGSSESIENKNKIRRLFKRYFQERDCITMVRPVEDEKDLQRLDELDNGALRKEFVVQVEAARSKIFGGVKPKCINGRKMSGNMFVELIKGYISIINQGALPTVESAWVYVSRGEGLKAVQEASRNTQKKIAELLKGQLLEEGDMELLRLRLVNQAFKQFKTKSMGSEESHPDLLQNLEKKVNSMFKDFTEANKLNWVTKYRQTSEKGVEQIKDKLFRDEYKSYADFLEDFNALKQQYEKETGSGADKWTYFNQAAENVHKLAGETITARINNSLQKEKQMLEERIQQTDAQFREKKSQLEDERERLREKVEDLERQQIRQSSSQAAAQQRNRELKEERDRLQDRCHKLELSNQEKALQIERLNSEAAQVNTLEFEEAKSQVRMLRSNLEKDRVLHDLEKSYHEKDIQNFKEKVSMLEAENRRLKGHSSNLEEELEQLRSNLRQQEEKAEEQQHLRETYQKKIDALTSENARKTELMNEHNDWILEKSYLENQVTFLKNTLNENKRLHDALLVALQRTSIVKVESVNTPQEESSNELVQTNKNLSSAMEKLESRCRLLEEKSEKLKKFKNIVKNCVALQCLHCSKWIANTTFPQHLTACAESSLNRHIQRLNTKENPTDSSGLHIAISQTLIKEVEENKPYTEYYIQLALGGRKWTVTRKYKNFCELQQSLLQMFPGVKFPESAAAIINVHTDINQIINSKRTIAVEERRKALQQFMRDLARIDQIRTSKPFRDFIRLDENLENEPLDQNNCGNAYYGSSVCRTESKRMVESPDAPSNSGTKKDSAARTYGSRSKFK